MPTGIRETFVKVGDVNEHGLIIIQRDKPNAYGTVYWIAECPVCKEHFSIRTNRFPKTTKCKSCSSELSRNSTVEGSWNGLYASTRCRPIAKERGFDLTLRQFIEISSKDCFYCGEPPKEKKFSQHWKPSIHFNGLDRIDSAGGYTLNNVRPCCIRCNMAKSDGTLDEMLEWALRLVERWK